MPVVGSKKVAVKKTQEGLTGSLARGRVQEVVWKGPEVDGVTQSMLQKFLVCRERFRVQTLLGLKAVEGFMHRLEYGNMWHVCEEWHAKIGDGREYGVVREPRPVVRDQPQTYDETLQEIGPGEMAQTVPQERLWEEALRILCARLCDKYPMQQEQVIHWMRVCKLQFPIYVRHWAEHPDVVNRVPLFQEQVFSIPFHLPSGRVVRLKGKFDEVNLGVERKEQVIWLKENKAKGEIDQQALTRQLEFDLQTGTYLSALMADQADPGGYLASHEQSGSPKFKRTARVAGVLYNVIRRPLSGGKGTISQWKPTKSRPEGETSEQFYERLAGVIGSASGDEWGVPDDQNFFFMRWNVGVTREDVERFQHRCLIPLLEDLCHWYDWVREAHERRRSPFEPVKGLRCPHWQHPFGVYNSLNENGSSEYDEFLKTGSTVGLRKVDDLFPELK